MTIRHFKWYLAIGAAAGLIILYFVMTRLVTVHEYNTFTAEVLEVNESWILVRPLEGEQELKSADRITLPVYDKAGNRFEDLEIGSIIDITYDGNIAESYPAQINMVQGIKKIE